MRFSCRAKITSDCKDEWEAEDVDYTDSTLDFDHTVICFACYVTIEPFMRMNREDLVGESNQALEHYRVNFDYVRNHPDPQVLVREAEERAAGSRYGSPFYVSAMACKAMAEIEVHRRTTTLHPDV